MRAVWTALVVAVPAIASAGPERPRWDRMLAETAGVFALGEGYYWSDPSNAYDRQMSGAGSPIERKLTGSGVRFDSNDFVTNAAKHPIVFGATMHELARENGFSFGEAFLVATAVSASWETFGELQEFASINDLVVTSPGGAPIGEAIYEIAHDPRNTRAEVHVGAGEATGGAFRTIGASAAHGRVTLAGELPFDTAPRGYYLHAGAEIAGVSTSGSAYDLHLGARVAYEYAQKEQRPGSPWDRLADVGLGPSLALDVHEGPLQIHGGLDATPEFAMVKSYAYAGWREEHPNAVVRGVLQTNPRPYYYAAGLAIAPRLSADLGPVTVGGRLGKSAYSSLDGLDRDDDRINTSIHLVDRDESAETWIGVRTGHYVVALDGREDHRSGELGTTRGEATDRMWLVTLGYRR